MSLKLFFKLLFVLLILFPVTGSAQQYLVLQKKNKLKNFKYTEGTSIHLQTLRGNFLVSGEITQIGDTSITIDQKFEIGLTNIGKIYKRRGFFDRLSLLLFIRGGISYFLIDGTNRLINNDYPIVDENTLLISGTMIAVGFALRPLVVRELDIINNWQLKILNFDEFKSD
ncbi:MAG: hypothetical protein EOM06_00220 [Sphingobacteriia bacterium]|nr:hypothetical protein [Sphingobacteriia bacterium]